MKESLRQSFEPMLEASFARAFRDEAGGYVSETSPASRPEPEKSGKDAAALGGKGAPAEALHAEVDRHSAPATAGYVGIRMLGSCERSMSIEDLVHPPETTASSVQSQALQSPPFVPPTPGPNASETYRSWYDADMEDRGSAGVNSMTPSWWVEDEDQAEVVWTSSRQDTKESTYGRNREIEVRMHRIWMKANGLQTSTTFVESNALDDTAIKTPSRLHALVMHPTSNGMLIWNIIGPFFLAYDLIAIPMRAFPLEDSGVLDMINIIIATYWTLDTIRGFLTGFETENSVEMRLDKIAKHYIKGWFALDLFTCVLDWIFIIAGSGGSFNKFWRTSRSLQAWRIIQPVRMARIARMNDRVLMSVKPLLDQILSVPMRIAIKSMNMAIVASVFCHYMACYWYFLGSDMDFEQNWLRAHKLQSSRDFSTLYSISFHWAVTQSGLSSSDIYPTNDSERTFACFASFFWLIIIAVTINNCSVWLSELRSMDGDRRAQRIDLIKYLDDHNISRKLTYEVLRCFRQNYFAHRRRLHEEDISFLKDLPLPLKLCLHKEVYLPSLRSHVFFKFLGAVSEPIPVMISHLAMRETHYPAGDNVFMEDTPASYMLHVLTGRLDYYAVQRDMCCTVLETKAWACEPALWLNWIHRGRLVTASSSEIMGIDVERFQAVLQDAKGHNKDLRPVQRFAEAVCKHFVELDPETDLWSDVGVMRQLAREVGVTMHLHKASVSLASCRGGSSSLFSSSADAAGKSQTFP